ncbi:MAG TPA: isoprenoid biosynthesis glyoxalase ElbB [Bacteriovoracaceae bacterium]|nr:isoprenoid biosynthesis glyoxalase ElbB [Bacteriovoracaceae bacterium]
MKKIAVVLGGSGFKDGSEIRESVLTLLALDEADVQFDCFAPDDNQYDVVNCLTGEAMNEKRNLLVEAARIARGHIKPVTELKASDYDGVMFPGGFGVAKNLCTFAFKGSEGEVRADVNNVIHDFYNAKKPIGAICIAPALIALSLKGKNLNLTLGSEGEAAEEIKKLGHRHTVTKPHECVVDRENKIVTSPAYMYDDARLKDIKKGIAEVVKAISQDL